MDLQRKRYDMDMEARRVETEQKVYELKLKQHQHYRELLKDGMSPEEICWVFPDYTVFKPRAVGRGRDSGAPAHSQRQTTVHGLSPIAERVSTHINASTAGSPESELTSISIAEKVKRRRVNTNQNKSK
jgi:hypothetical protein